MDKVTVACVQMRMRLTISVDEYRDDLHRYLRAADAKRTRILLFPELAGVMIAPLLLRDRGTRLLATAERSQRRSAGTWARLQGRFARWAASLLKADLYSSIAGLIDVDPEAIWTLYAEIYSGLARRHGITIVAPSGYLPGPEGGPIENRCAVFGPNGDLLGMQSKVLGYDENARMPQRGNGWSTVQTEVGLAGIVLGSDILYPEVGRLLASQGADFLLVQGACPSPAYYNKIRAGTLARMQDNQLYAAMSLLVGPSPLRSASHVTASAGRQVTEQALYAGRSAIFAPQELTPRSNGVLVEMGAGQGEGVVTAEWDFAALHDLWETSDTPLRRPLPAADAALLLGALWTQLPALVQKPQAELLLEAPSADEEALGDDAGSREYGSPSAGQSVSGTTNVHVPTVVAPAHSKSRRSPFAENAVDLDALPVLASVTSRWPLPSSSRDEAPVGEETVDWPTLRRAGAASAPSQIRREDETDEMDAVESGRLPADEAAADTGAKESEPKSED